MTDEEARGWVQQHFDRPRIERLETFAALVSAENERQNLVAPSTLASLWSRHIVDSLQLVALAPARGTWLDIGTGGGFPGLAVAIVRPEPMVLVEPRKRRAEFLATCADQLALLHVDVRVEKVERVAVDATVISARAVSSVENLLHAARHCATAETRWLLPRGQLDRAGLDRALLGSGWMFHVEQSLTSEQSAIVVLQRR